MNERIQALAVEAGLIVNEWDGFNRRQLNPAEQKFAELIVAECMQLNSKELSITAIERLLPFYEEHFGVDNERNDGHENIIRGVEIHSDKGYKVATVEDYEEFIKNRK